MPSLVRSRRIWLGLGLKFWNENDENREKALKERGGDNPRVPTQGVIHRKLRELNRRWTRINADVRENYSSQVQVMNWPFFHQILNNLRPSEFICG
jgi:hypothetical protein